MQSFFVSSTFKDMQGERDALHRIVLPRLREKAATYGQNVEFVDLRWGISTQDMDSEEGASKIMEVCLDEIESCRPYMIILLGERYGWMPDPQLIQSAIQRKNIPLENHEMSITELEIQYGMLLNSEYLDHLVFCMRKPLSVESMPEELTQMMVCATKEESARLEKLKEHIRAAEGVNLLEYDIVWDEQAGELRGYDKFAEDLSNHLEQMMVQEWGKPRKQCWQERQLQEDRLLGDTLTGSFIGREQEITDALKKLQDTDVYVLEAEGGSGKSAFVSVMAKKLESAQVIYCGNSSDCANVEQLLQILCWRLGAAEGEEEPEDANVEKWREHWYNCAANYRGEPVTIFIDAIDQLARDDALFQSWYLPYQFSDRIKIVITTTGAVQVNPQAFSGIGEKSGIRCVKENLSRPDEAGLRKIIRKMFLAEHKEISEENMEEIVSHPCSSNMLALSIMVRRLSMLGKKEFQKIHEMEKTMDGDMAIRKYLSSMIHNFPKDLKGLIDKYLEDVCYFLFEGLEGDSNRIILYLIAAAENGLSKLELEELQKFTKNHRSFSQNEAWCSFWNELKFSRMKRYLGNFLIEHSYGKIDFTHRLLREGLRSNHAVKYCAIVLLSYFTESMMNSDIAAENVLPLCRQLFEKMMGDGENINDIAKNCFSEFIAHVGSMSESNREFEVSLGNRWLSAMQKSVLMDLSGADAQKNLNIYCEVLWELIAGGASPRQWTIWFFDEKIAQVLWDRGDIGKTKAIQIYLAMTSAFMDPKHKTNRKNYNEMQSRDLCKMFYCIKRLEKMLTNSIENERISGKDYGYTWEAVLKDGEDWMLKHLKKYPEDFVVRNYLAGVYVNEADMRALWMFASKDFEKAERALDELRKLPKFETSPAAKRQYVIRCTGFAEACLKRHWYAMLDKKKHLNKAIEKSEMALEVLEHIPLEERTISMEAGLINVQAQIYSMTGRLREAMDILWNYYQRINDSEDSFRDNQRAAFSGVIMLLIEYLFRYKNIHLGGKGKYFVAKELLLHEEGYIRASVNEDFVSRYYWARILQLRACCKKKEGKEDAVTDLAEARRVFEILAEEQQKSEKGLNIWCYDAKKALKDLDALYSIW